MAYLLPHLNLDLPLLLSHFHSCSGTLTHQVYRDQEVADFVNSKVKLEDNCRIAIYSFPALGNTTQKEGLFVVDTNTVLSG